MNARERYRTVLLTLMTKSFTRAYSLRDVEKIPLSGGMNACYHIAFIVQDKSGRTSFSFWGCRGDGSMTRGTRNLKQ